MKPGLTFLLFAFATALAVPESHGAQSFPTKPIRIIVPFPPGDSLDIMSRLIAPKMPDVKERLNAIGLTVATESPEWFAKVLKSDFDKYGKLVKTIGLQPQ